MSALAGDLASALDPVVFARGSGFDAETWQQRLLRSQAKRALVLCARQVGKTQTVSHKALHTALYTPKRDVLIVSPTQRQSDEMLLRVSSLFKGMREQPRLKRDNASEMSLANGSRVVSLPGSEGGIRGFSGVKLLILDEASRIDDDVFASVLPMVASDGQILALSTPWGRRGWFYDLHEDPVNAWERHKVTVYESEQYTPARIKEVRDSLGSFVFGSDYECIFGDTDTQLFGTEHVRAAFSRAVKPLEFT
ncbi:terminase large subunit domain-containing protein [Cryobacterium sp. TMS1-20-1]|uniref:terminase large subunit domain-containing protein n=1 Tax=Cryobacterium sp. TMS1-20-1 TaxID=1259223 RepID=UPI00141B7398|nr:terminase family protein [Cryobacterium sp. TMS1-20-1]